MNMSIESQHCRLLASNSIVKGWCKARRVDWVEIKDFQTVSEVVLFFSSSGAPKIRHIPSSHRTHHQCHGYAKISD